MRMGALLLVVPILTAVGAGSPAQAADQVGVPAAEPGPAEAKLIVAKGGDRTDSGVSPLAGAQFQFFRAGSASELSGGTALLDADSGAVTCTTDASGQCGVIVPLVGSSDNFFYAEEVAAPAGWSVADVWGSATDYLRYNSGAVRSSNADRVRNLPPAGRTWPDIRDNPTAPQKCGLDIRMIFDVSHSISDSELATFKDAGKGAITALEGTPSRVSLSRFASQAAEVQPLTSVTTTSSADTVRAAIDGLDRSGFGDYTNWDRALWGSATSGETYDVALILTDGDPTVYGDLPTGDTQRRQVEEAIHSANALKAKGTQVISVGVDLTAADSIKRLNLISSPGSTYTTSWQQIGPDLRKIATGFCNKVVTLQKVVKDWQGNVLANATESNGWQFGGLIDSPATIGTFAPTGMINGQNGFTSAPVSIGADQSPVVTITETPRAGWTYQGATCTVNGQDVAATQTQTPGTFTFPGKANAAMTCVVTNQQAQPVPAQPVPAPPVPAPPAPAPQVLPVQSFGKAVGSVRASCQGTVRAKLSNRSGETVTYKLRVGSKVHRIAVKSQAKKKFFTHGDARARVTLKVGSTKLDKLRIPALCEAPEVLPDTGVRAAGL
jgi:hypothetical protein